ncbi:MAG: hypothetical protein EP329_27840 [Deltaproteobacteria bacterium]|nr:MAG: hypothetical protein EP329_27840 [Deltaproteobacteria bacterium]
MNGALVLVLLGATLALGCGSDGGGSGTDTAVGDDTVVADTTGADAVTDTDTATGVDTATDTVADTGGPVQCLQFTSNGLYLYVYPPFDTAEGHVIVENHCAGTVAFTELGVTDTHDYGDCGNCGFQLTPEVSEANPALVEVAAGEALNLEVLFRAPDGGLEDDVEGLIRLVWADGEREIPVHAYPGIVPDGCISFGDGEGATGVAHAKDFGEVPVGTTEELVVPVTNHCVEPVEFIEIDLTETRGEGFSVDLSDLPGAPDGALTTLDPRVALAGGEAFDLVLRYTPVAESEFGDQTLLHMSWMRSGELLDLFDTGYELTGQGLDASCPHPRITVAEGADSEPGSTLHLSATDSVATSGGAITSWSWSVTAPAGSTASFLPNATSESVTFTPDVQGIYVFELRVADASGASECEPATAQVNVGQVVSLKVYVSWQTIGGGSYMGPDINVHLAHPNAAGPDLWGDATPEPWYDALWDCYWYTVFSDNDVHPGNPDWGVAGYTADDPWIDEDQTGASGEEQLILAQPEAGLTYRVGVDRYVYPSGDDSVVEVAVRVRLGTEQKLLLEHKIMAPGDFWEVATVSIADGAVTTIDEVHSGIDTKPPEQ